MLNSPAAIKSLRPSSKWKKSWQEGKGITFVGCFFFFPKRTKRGIYDWFWKLWSVNSLPANFPVWSNCWTWVSLSTALFFISRPQMIRDIWHFYILAQSCSIDTLLFCQFVKAALQKCLETLLSKQFCYSSKLIRIILKIAREEEYLVFCKTNERLENERLNLRL